MTIQDLYHQALLDGDQMAERRLAELAKEVKAKADAAWDSASDGHRRGYHSTADSQRGRGHALCEVLGDQAFLSMHGAFD